MKILLLIALFFAIYFIIRKISLKKDSKLNKQRIKYLRDISYIKRVFNSCTNYFQLENAYNWALKYIQNYAEKDDFYFRNSLQEIKNLFQIYKFRLEKPTKQEVAYLLEKSQSRDSFIRKGQWLFNELYKMYPNFANTIRGTEYDPFYDDNRINKFINYINN